MKGLFHLIFVTVAIQLSSSALAAPGDVDPGFGDVGRLAAIDDAEGPVWSLVALNDGTVLLAGGDFDLLCGEDGKDVYCDSPPVGYRATNFLITVSDGGVVTSRIDTADFRQVQIRDLVRQQDGKLVGVGRRALGESSLDAQLTVFRIEADGRLDSTFGNGGLVELPFRSLTSNLGGRAVILDPDGAIVVAGSRDGRLLVLRLLRDGSFDGSFGESGIYEPMGVASTGVGILHAANGSYRILDSHCTVVAVTPSGVLDASFGSSGRAQLSTPEFCRSTSFAALQDGSLVVGGFGYPSGLQAAFVSRLHADGSADSSFDASAVSDAMAIATALTVEEDDSILVAGESGDDTMVMRLSAGGDVDPQFGNGGSTLIDLPIDLQPNTMRAHVNKLLIRPDGVVIAAGGDHSAWWRPAEPFAIRLLGKGSGNGPGVLSVADYNVLVSEPDEDEVVVNVRRTGGKTGSVSVAFRTDAHNFNTATGGEDFREVSGFLSWDDGDVSTKEIRVSIHDDTLSEGYESFLMRLDDVQGGAGLGIRNGIVAIEDDEATPPPPAPPPPPPPPPPPDGDMAGSGGGGAIGCELLLLFGLLAVRRQPGCQIRRRRVPPHIRYGWSQLGHGPAGSMRPVEVLPETFPRTWAN